MPPDPETRRRQRTIQDIAIASKQLWAQTIHFKTRNSRSNTGVISLHISINTVKTITNGLLNHHIGPLIKKGRTLKSRRMGRSKLSF